MTKPPSSTSNNTGDQTTVLSGDLTLKQEMQKAKEQDACLIIIRGTPQGHRYFITQDEMIIGREPSADISISDQSISRQHAKVVRVGTETDLVDLGSRNGTFINDHQLKAGETRRLAKEDMVKLGNSILKYLPKGELEILFYGNLGNAAHMDPLTKIYNKGYLAEALEAEFKRAKALHTDFSILFLDIDFFKKINDTHGHDAGDHVLREFAQLIRSQFLRPKDVFARYGGEEFVVLLSNTSAQVTAEIAERMRAGIESYAFVYEGKRIPVTSSLGIAELTTEIQSAQTLMKIADKALYSAKQTGRNRIVVGS